jgi:type VI secretion system protein ImpH
MTILERLAQQPFDIDFYQAMLGIECLHPDKPRWGEALRPADEPLRLGQDASLAFPPGELSSFKPADGKRAARLNVNCFGLLGPNGALPLHLTDFVRERALHAGDHTFGRFLDLLQHRFIALFYRAWAQAQPQANFDRPDADRYFALAASLIGLGSPRAKGRDAVPNVAKVFRAGWLVRQSRNADGLVALLRSYFKLPIDVQQFSGHWMTLPVSERTALNGTGNSAVLGGGAVLGARVWDRQHGIRICVGPLKLSEYEHFLPGGKALPKLVAWLRTYLTFELHWDVKLALERHEVPRTRLGQYGQLGWTTWLGHYHHHGPASDLVLDAERAVAARRQAQPRKAAAAAPLAEPAPRSLAEALSS